MLTACLPFCPDKDDGLFARLLAEIEGELDKRKTHKGSDQDVRLGPRTFVARVRKRAQKG